MTPGPLTVTDVQSALKLPDAALVNRRIPKKLLAERSPTAADRRLVQDNVEQISWIAALKPSNVGISPLVDSTRDYIEVSVLSVDFRGIDCDSQRGRRLAELTHRAIPYPIMLLASSDGQLAISLSHVRRAQDGTASVVLDGPLYWTLLTPCPDTVGEISVRQALAGLEVGRQPWASFWDLYQAWIEVVVAWHAVPISGAFTLPNSPDRADAMCRAIVRIGELQQEIESLRRAAAKERQIARLAEMNQSIQRLLRAVESEKQQL
jgi:hypothetical protein